MAEWHDTPAWRTARAKAKTVLEPVCVTCGKNLDGKDWTIDHIQAPLQGDPNHDISNLQSMCRSCNSRKGDRTQERTNWLNPKYFGL